MPRATPRPSRRAWSVHVMAASVGRLPARVLRAEWPDLPGPNGGRRSGGNGAELVDGRHDVAAQALEVAGVIDLGQVHDHVADALGDLFADGGAGVGRGHAPGPQVELDQRGRFGLRRVAAGVRAGGLEEVHALAAL